MIVTRLAQRLGIQPWQLVFLLVVEVTLFTLLCYVAFSGRPTRDESEVVATIRPEQIIRTENGTIVFIPNIKE